MPFSSCSSALRPLACISGLHSYHRWTGGYQTGAWHSKCHSHVHFIAHRARCTLYGLKRVDQHSIGWISQAIVLCRRAFTLISFFQRTMHLLKIFIQLSSSPLLSASWPQLHFFHALFSESILILTMADIFVSTFSYLAAWYQCPNNCFKFNLVVIHDTCTQLSSTNRWSYR